MIKRLAVIGSATALAALVLFLTMLAEPSSTSNNGAAQKLTPQDAPLPIPDITHAGPGLSQTPFESARQYRYSRVNNQGQLIQIFGETLTPRPQGVSEVEKPGVRIHLTPSRVIEVRAERGTFVAPDNQPRNGEFKGRVVLTLFEGPGERAVDLSPGSADVGMRVFLQDAKFDLELGQIESRGPVHVTGPRLDFRGRDLTLVYSESRGRIERLEIAEGRQLRLKPGSRGDSAEGEPARSEDRRATTAPADRDEKVEPAEVEKPVRKKGVTQYYAARLEKGVTISSKDIEADADRMNLWFSMDRKDTAKLGAAPSRTTTTAASPVKPGDTSPTTKPATSPAPAAPTAAVKKDDKSAPPSAPSRDFGIGAPLPPDEVMAPPGVDDVTIAWTGPMVVEPTETMPDRITAPDDYALELVGEPVRITTSNKDVITAASFDYLGSTGRIRLTGSGTEPMTLDSPNLGVLRGPQLVIDQSTGLGQVIGAGSLQAHGDPGLADTVDARTALERGGTAKLPRGMDITWNDRLDLSFYLRPQRDADDVNRLRGIKDVMFRGEVKVQHLDFDVRADRLNLSLNDPEKGTQTLEAIHASGGVIVNGRGGNDGDLSIKSDQLEIELARGEKGQVEPRRLLARGSVEAAQPGRVLKTGALDVGLGMVDATVAATQPVNGNGKSAGKSERRVVVKTMRADQGVTIVTGAPVLNLSAMRLSADTEADQVELFGLPDKPVRIERDGSILSGEHIIMGQTSKTVHVVGPGRFAFMSRSSKPTAGGEKNNQTLVTVVWTEAMHFADDVGLAQFTGKVQTRARTDKETSRLLADDLRLKFVHVENLGPAVVETVKGDGLRDSMNRSDRAIHSVTARGNVLFEAESWTDKAQSDLGTRLTITGDHMHFEESREEVQVVGAGRMLFEDYRPEAKPKAAADKSESPIVSFTGRGATLFTWKGRLLLDAYHNDMLIQDRVQMIHRAKGKPEVMQLDCQNFLSDLEATGGLGVWLSSSAPQPEIKAVLADRDVRLIAYGRTITADHLQYTGSDQTLTLRADQGKLVSVNDERDHTTRSFSWYRWDLLKDMHTVDNPSSTIVPIQR